jgi:hypothetical protein
MRSPVADGEEAPFEASGTTGWLDPPTPKAFVVNASLITNARWKRRCAIGWRYRH